VRDTADLKRRLIETWSSIPPTVINAAIDEWRLLLPACVKAKGGHFEHSLYPTDSFQSHPHYIEENSYPTLKYFKYSVNTEYTVIRVEEYKIYAL